MGNILISIREILSTSCNIQDTDNVLSAKLLARYEEPIETHRYPKGLFRQYELKDMK